MSVLRRAAPFFILGILFLVHDAPCTDSARTICDDQPIGNYISIGSFNQITDLISSHIQNTSFGTAVIKQNNSRNYGLAQCYNNTSSLDCALCYKEARTILSTCFPTSGGRVFLHVCFLRVGNYNFLHEISGPIDLLVCTNAKSGGTRLGEPAIDAVRTKVLYGSPHNTDLALTLPINKDEVVVTIMGECWKPLNTSACGICMEDARHSALLCLPWSEGYAMKTGCFVRYSNNNFHNRTPTDNPHAKPPANIPVNPPANAPAIPPANPPTNAPAIPPANPPASRKKKATVMFAARCGAVATILIIGASFGIYMRNKIMKKGSATENADTTTSKIMAALFQVNCSIILPKMSISQEVKMQNHIDIELFLRNTENLAPKRYKYANLKKITNSFSDRLGKGGFGSIYKGKLQDGRLVAVKILNHESGGEEFMNEIASITRTSHINIVSLLGFCSEGAKRALVYEFMPNGSLEKFLCDNTSSIVEGHHLGWEKLFEIAVGVAQGLEYLHQGCSTRILHLDIKPHNILLDDGMRPKISDFGLAKLCPNRASIISMLGARGTIGYIAPEIFCRNFGEVSHKSDVYSYGMLVLEMIGGRKNVWVESASDIYFPDWIYSELEKNEQSDGIEEQDEECHFAKRKLAIIGLWCIQTDPNLRPPISRVIEMLVGDLESLQIPPKPYLFSPPRVGANISTFGSSI